MLFYLFKHDTYWEKNVSLLSVQTNAEWGIRELSPVVLSNLFESNHAIQKTQFLYFNLQRLVMTIL